MQFEIEQDLYRFIYENPGIFVFDLNYSLTNSETIQLCSSKYHWAQNYIHLLSGDAQSQNRDKHDGFRGYCRLGDRKEQQQQQQNSRVLQKIEKGNSRGCIHIQVSSHIADCGWGTWFSILR